MADITMPRLSESMTTGRLLRWNVKPGDKVREGDVVAEVETDKANMEIESLATGVVESITARPGEDLPVGAVLGTIAEISASSGSPAASSPASDTAHHVNATLAAIKRAEELAVNVRDVAGTGPNGRVLTQDVEDHAKTQTARPTGESTPIYRFPGGFALRARSSSDPLRKSLANIDQAVRPAGATGWTRERSAAITLMFAAYQALLSTIKKHGKLDLGTQTVPLTLITARDLDFVQLPLSEFRTLESLGSSWKPAVRQLRESAPSMEATIAMGAGLDSIEPLNPGAIHLSLSLVHDLNSDLPNDLHITLTTEGDSRLPFGVEFLRIYQSLLSKPLSLLGAGN